MEIDYSILQPYMDDLLLHLIIILGIPVVAALIIKTILIAIKVPRLIAGYLAGLAFLYLAYQLFVYRIV